MLEVDRCNEEKRRLSRERLSWIDRFSLGPNEEGSKRGRDGSRGGRDSS